MFILGLPLKFMSDSKRQTTERWLPVADFEGLYEVSDCGRVRSFGRFRRGRSDSRVWRDGRMLKLVPRSKKRGGYLCVNLVSVDGKCFQTDVHRLVAAAFCPGYFEGAHVNHMDGCKTHNHASNLEWLTQHANMRHAYENGLTHYRSEESVRAICADRQRGMKLREISVKHGIPIHAACLITSGKRFQWIDRQTTQRYQHPGRIQFRCLERLYEDDCTSVSYWKPIPRITQGATP